MLHSGPLNSAPAGAVITIRARRPYRPTNRTVTSTPPTSTVRDWPSEYQSMLRLVAEGTPSATRSWAVRWSCWAFMNAVPRGVKNKSVEVCVKLLPSMDLIEFGHLKQTVPNSAAVPVGRARHDPRGEPNPPVPLGHGPCRHGLAHVAAVLVTLNKTSLDASAGDPTDAPKSIPKGWG